MGEKIDDKFLSFALLNGVDSDYESLVMMLLRKTDNSSPPFEEVKTALLEESSRRASKNAEEKEVSALTSRSFSKKKSWKNSATITNIWDTLLLSQNQQREFASPSQTFWPATK